MGLVVLHGCHQIVLEAYRTTGSFEKYGTTGGAKPTLAQCSSAGGETRGGRRRTEEEAGDKRDRSKQAQIRRPKISCDEDQQITRAKNSFCDKKKGAWEGARGLWSEPVAAHKHGLQTAQFHMVT